MTIAHPMRWKLALAVLMGLGWAYIISVTHSTMGVVLPAGLVGYYCGIAVGAINKASTK